jgi:hypothetical protein
MEPQFVDDYEKREWIGREALKHLQSLYPESFKYDIHFTQGKYDDYDAFYFIYDNDNKFKKYVWIEIKVRYESFNEYFLEKKKLDRMIQQRDKLFLKEDEVVFLYLNFTPSGTYCWNITGMEKGYWDKVMMNTSTSNNKIDKQLKAVKLLSPSSGKTFDYIYDEKQLLRNYKINYLLPKVEKKIKKTGGLDFLFD